MVSRGKNDNGSGGVIGNFVAFRIATLLTDWEIYVFQNIENIF